MITIIVLIILAGVSINLVLGDNHIIKKALDTKEKIEQIARDEQELINELNGEVSQIKDNTPGDITDAGKQDGSENKPYNVKSVEDFLALIQISRETGLYNKFVNIETDLDFKNPTSYSDPNNTTIFGDYNKDGVTKGIMEELTDENKNGFKNGFEFTGILNGNGHTISNIYMQETLLYNKSYHGDFCTGIFHENKGTIKNINFEGKINAIIDSQSTAAAVGGIVALNKHGGQLINCTSNMQITITGSNIEMSEDVVILAGGIAAVNEDETENTKIDECINKGKIECNLVFNSKVSTEYYHQVRIGGIVGNNKAILTNSLNKGIVNATKNFYTTIGDEDCTLDIGGIAGKNYRNYRKFYQCWNNNRFIRNL